jgi:saccharopine dehydrogenase-like NADP-dependent oxidoreductase
MCYTGLWKLDLTEESHTEVDTMKIVVLGGYGDMGQGAVQDLIVHTDAQVVIADYRIEGAKAYAAQLGPRATAVFVDANDPALLVSVLRGADAAVGAWMLAQGQVEAKGVYAPEGCLQPEPFFAEFAKRDIKIEELAAS